MENGSGKELSLRELSRIANEMFAKVIAAGETLYGQGDEDWKNRSCGYLVFKKVGADGPLLTTIIGGEGGNYDRRFKYRRYALEKAARLEANLAEGHLTSWESRNPDEDEWGGAIVICIEGEYYILSFSGIPERGDEVLNLLIVEVFLSTDQAVASQCLVIIDRTANPLYQGLRAAVRSA